MLDSNISNSAKAQAQSCYEIDVGVFANADAMSGHESDHRLIVALVQWVGTTPADVATRAGMPPSTVNRHYKKPANTRISQPTWDKLKAAFPGFPGWKSDQPGQPELPPSNARIIPMEGASLEQPRDDLEVWGSGLGSEREFEGEAVELTRLNTGDIVEYVRRPTILNGKRGVYALYIQGSSMHPVLPDGEMIVAARDMPMKIGDNVVVYLRTDDVDADDGQASRGVLVKELVRRSASYVELRQYQPQKDFRVEMSQVVRIDRILTRREMLS